MTMLRSVGSFKSSDKAFLFCCYCVRPAQALLLAGPKGPSPIGSKGLSPIGSKGLSPIGR